MEESGPSAGSGAVERDRAAAEIRLTPKSSGFLLRAWGSPVTKIHDLPYREGLLADLYIPDNFERPLPTIIWLHPGGWIAGNRKTAPDLSRFIAERGFAIVSIDYRLSRESIFPAALDDVISAISWVRSVADTYGLAPGRIGLWGASAGGHLAALAALSGPQPGIRAVVDCYGPSDFLRMGATHLRPSSYESRFLGSPIDTVPDLVRQANPATYARADAPPFLILHGMDDTEVFPEQSVLLYEALAAAGADATLCLIDGLAHGFITDDFAANTTGRVRIRECRPGLPEYSAEAPPLNFGVIETFFRKHL